MARTPAERLPGNLTSPRAGPILCRCAPIINRAWVPARADIALRDPEPYTEGKVSGLMCVTEADEDGTDVTLLDLDLTADLGPTIALRWLGRHYGIDVGIGCPGWSRFGGTSPVWCLHTAKIDLWFASGGRSAVDRCATNIFDVPGISAITDPLEALVAACVHAAGA